MNVELPPSDPKEFRDEMAHPFQRASPMPRDATAKHGQAQVPEAANGTSTMPNPDDFAAELQAESNLAGLARHEPHGADGAPHDTIAGQDRWNAFEDVAKLAEMEPRRGRVAAALSKVRFIGRNR